MNTQAAHRTSRQPGLDLDETANVDAIEQAIDEVAIGAGGEEAEGEGDMPTNSEIDESIANLEERAEEISRGGNADVELEVDPE